MPISTSNSYVTFAEYQAYMEATGQPVIAQATIEPKLMQATLALDRKYGSRFLGRKIDALQPLQWPRIATSERSINLPDGFYSVDADGNYRDFNQVPTEVKQGTCELAMELIRGVDVYAQPAPGLTEETVKVDVIQKTQKFAGTYYKADSSADYKLNMILRPVLMPATGGVRWVI